MAKILNSTTINGNVSKMIETPDQFIINGNTYDKNNLSPNAFDFLPIYVTSNNEMILSQVVYVNSYWYRNKTNNGFMLDSNDPNSFYIATQSLLGSNANASFHNITRGTNGLIDNTQWTAFPNGYYTFMDLISQDTQNVYYTINRNYGGYYSYIGSYSKLTNNGANLNINTGTIKLLKDSGNYLYISAPSTSANAINIGKYNKISNTMSWLLQETGLTAGYYSDTYPSDVDVNGVFYYARDGITYGKTDHFIVYRKYILNTMNDTVNVSTVNVDMSLLPSNNIFWNSGSNMAVAHELFKFTDTNTGKTYMNHLVYNKGTQTIALQGVDSGLYTYEMIDADNWKLVSYTSFNPIVYNAFLSCINNSVLGLAYNNGAHFYVWDSSSTSYKKTCGYDVPVDAIGIDTNNNIYIQYSDSSVEMISNVMPTTIFADFDLDIYQYNGADVAGNVIVYVKNYTGKYLTSSINLTLYGNIKFTDSGLKTKTVTTSNLGQIAIPITVVDQGNLRVTATLMN